MSQKGRLRRLDAGVRWLETEGTYLRIAGLVKCLEMLMDIADRRAVDPAFAARWDRDFSYVRLPPPRSGVQPAAPKSKPAPPPPRPPEPAIFVPRQTLPPQAEPKDTQPTDSEPAQVPLPVSPITIEPCPPPVVPAVQRPPPRPPEPPPPMPGQPTSLRSPDMEIRPMHWRQRGPQDYEDDDTEDDSYGRCLTEYDVLGDDYDSDDTDD